MIVKLIDKKKKKEILLNNDLDLSDYDINVVFCEINKLLLTNIDTFEKHFKELMKPIILPSNCVKFIIISKRDFDDRLDYFYEHITNVKIISSKIVSMFKNPIDCDIIIHVYRFCLMRSEYDKEINEINTQQEIDYDNIKKYIYINTML